LTKALVFEPNSPDVLHERGIVNFKSKDFTAAVKDLSICLKQEKDNKSAYTYLGLAFASLGEYKKAEEAHLKSIQLDSNYLEAWLHLAQFYQELADHCKALECIEQVLQVDNRVWKAYHLRGLVFHGLGEHRYVLLG
jgi:tetratricopeptide (TPR) repeat protein